MKEEINLFIYKITFVEEVVGVESDSGGQVLFFFTDFGGGGLYVEFEPGEICKKLHDD